jgi:hypothetical protein
MTKEERREYHRKYREANREKLKAYYKKYYDSKPDKAAYTKWSRSNPEKLKVCKLKSNQKHKEKRSAYNKEWRQRNKGLVTHYSRIYQLAKEQATPKWLSSEQAEEIKKIYSERPDGYHVDHIVPIKGKTVRGLHVPWNLQYLPASENCKKHNK